MSPLSSLKNNIELVSTATKVVLIMIAGVIIGICITIWTSWAYTGNLLNQINTVAAVLDAKPIADLTSDDPKNFDNNYAQLRLRLAAAKTANNDAKFVYVMAKDNNNNIYFVADSEDKNSDDFSPFGEKYNDASPAFQQMFINGQAMTEGPVKDDYGSWLSALAPIDDPTDGSLLAVVGIDIPASNYISLLVLSALSPVVIASMVAAAIIVSDRIRRRRLEAVRFRSELVSIASHELRTPLTGIRWSEETLMKANIADTERSMLQVMYDSTLRLQESIEDILQLANLQGIRSQMLQIASVDLSNIIKGIFATQKLPAQQNSIELVFDNDWPDKLVVNCDQLCIKRVFNNLISNAIKYTRPGTKVTVSYHLIEGKHVITITDQGIGIPKTEQDKVFSGFYRATNAVKSTTNGTGMGLYLSKTTIEQHGGKIWLNSEENKGTRVYVQLP